MALRTIATVFLVIVLTAFVAFDPNNFFTVPEPQGIVDDCCCTIETVNEHFDYIFKELNYLVKGIFFKYFKVNFVRSCPFWAENYLCTIQEGEGGCGVCVCDENEIPTPWKQSTQRVDRTVSSSELSPWDENNENVWIYQDEEQDMEYINLELNPERYTGYSGYNATRIWSAIYRENCFHHTGERDLCFEERVFYRLISGFHASTTSHIFENYHTEAGWNPNVKMYFERLGNFPDRLTNIYFTFLFLLRATSHASKFLSEYTYDTGNPTEDNQISDHINLFLNNDLIQSCSPTFNESEMFRDTTTQQLKREFRAKFINISEIMDCVSCETCKVHAKLQILGIGTALKILLSQNREMVLHDLQRNEIIALINTLFKFGESLEIIHLMHKRQRGAHQRTVAIAGAAIIVTILIVKTVWGRKKKVQPSKKKQQKTNKKL